MTDNQDFGRRFFPAGLVRYPEPFVIPKSKAAGTLRIFVLGESAAMGDPDPKFGLPRMLEVLLRERFPERHVEVVNAAMVAIDSHVIRSIARDCAGQQGDLWVIYMGNNETIGPFGSASVFGAQAPALPLVRAGLWAKTTRLGQLLDSGLDSLLRSRRLATAWEGMEMMAGQRVRHDAPVTTRVHEHFARNLTDVLTSGTRAGVPIILCTVATNLRDCAPFASLHRPGLGPSELAQWQSEYDTGVVYQAQGNLAAAKSSYEQAAWLDSDYAELSFRLASCCMQLGQDAEAAELFRRARDLDALQFRADGPLNESIRQTSKTFTKRGVTLLDAERLFETNSPHRAPGAEYFYEHVHLTPEGNYLLARAVAEQTIKALRLSPQGQWVSESECLRLLGLTDWNRYDALEIIRERLQHAPFTNQVGHALADQRLSEQLAQYRNGTKPAEAQREVRLVSELVNRSPENPALRWNLATLMEIAGDLQGAEGQWRKLIEVEPQAALPRFNLARVLERLERPTEAYPLYDAGLQINPDYYLARQALGELCLRLNRVEEAVHHLKLVVREKPLSVDARLSLGEALRRAGRQGEAAGELREALRLEPQNLAVQRQLRELETTSPVQ